MRDDSLSANRVAAFRASRTIDSGSAAHRDACPRTPRFRLRAGVNPILILDAGLAFAETTHVHSHIHYFRGRALYLLFEGRTESADADSKEEEEEREEDVGGETWSRRRACKASLTAGFSTVAVTVTVHPRRGGWALGRAEAGDVM